jgi:hypothetical protein
VDGGDNLHVLPIVTRGPVETSRLCSTSRELTRRESHGSWNLKNRAGPMCGRSRQPDKLHGGGLLPMRRSLALRLVEAPIYEWIVRAAAVILTLACGLFPCLTTAQPASSCAGCVSAAGCDDKRASCVAECRARIFSIDPRRAECVTDCSNKAGQCSRLAVNGCLAKNLCR